MDSELDSTVTRSGLRRRPAAPRSNSSTRQLIEPGALAGPAGPTDACASGIEPTGLLESFGAALDRDADGICLADTSEGWGTGGFGSASAGWAEPRGRRDSLCSMASSDDEHDAGLVYRILTGRVRPPSPIIEAGEGDGLGGGNGSGSGPTPHDPAQAEPHPSPGRDDQQDDKPCCRICFDTDEDEDSGTLFSPCKCAGTARFVHTQCLRSWRIASVNADSFWKCNQCQYEYQLHRTKAAYILSHPATLVSATFGLFLLLVVLSGFAANSIIRATEAAVHSPTSLFEDIFVSDHVILGEGVREAVDFFAGQVESSRWGSAIVRHANEKPVRPALSVEESRAMEAEMDKTRLGRFRKWYRHARGRGGPPIEPKLIREAGAGSPWIVRATMHMFKGLSLVGMLSFFQIWATAFLTPFGRTFFRTQRRNGANESVAQAVIIAFVIIGALKAVVQVYWAVRWLSKSALRRVEERVLNVN